MFYRVTRGVLRPLTQLAYRPTIEGVDHVPRTGGLVIASNHLSFIDSFAIPLAAPRRVSFLAKADYFTQPGVIGGIRRNFFESIGSIPVDRLSPSAAQDSLEAALTVLQGGGAFGIYPEGTRSRDGRLYKGRTGAAWLSLKANVPIVPVGLIGTADIQPVGERIPRLAKVTVRFGAPIQPQAYADMPAGKARRLLTNDLMDAIAALSGQERVDAFNELPAVAGPPVGL